MSYIPRTRTPKTSSRWVSYLVFFNFIMLLAFWGCIIAIVVMIQKSGIAAQIPQMISQAAGLVDKADKEFDQLVEKIDNIESALTTPIPP